MPNKEQDKLILELIKRQAAGVENALPVPVPSHRPVSDADILRTQLADYDQQRMEPTRPQRQLGQELTPDELNETVANLLPGGGPASAILAPGSPIRNPQIRQRMLDRLVEQAEKFLPETGMKMLRERIARSPRTMAHYAETLPLNDPQSAAMHQVMESSLNNPRGKLHINPKLVDEMAFGESLAHEVRHGTRMIQEADRARRRAPRGADLDQMVDPEQAPFTNKFRDEYYSHGESRFKTPTEREARVSENDYRLRRQQPQLSHTKRRRLANDQADDIIFFRDMTERALPPKKKVDEKALIDLINALMAKKD